MSYCQGYCLPLSWSNFERCLYNMLGRQIQCLLLGQRVGMLLPIMKNSDSLCLKFLFYNIPQGICLFVLLQEFWLRKLVHWLLLLLGNKLNFLFDRGVSCFLPASINLWHTCYFGRRIKPQILNSSWYILKLRNIYYL